ncbi:uncharacterized protein BJX67DRAFT_87866 [Aspergillus lucknowensis]|uniref:Uncharacterized protein n=1 Tax=Aspergillus lucknowensis TaxID=176173 RepID=A0ABR4M5D3_9EURO
MYATTRYRFTPEWMAFPAMGTRFARTLTRQTPSQEEWSTHHLVAGLNHGNGKREAPPGQVCFHPLDRQTPYPRTCFTNPYIHRVMRNSSWFVSQAGGIIRDLDIAFTISSFRAFFRSAFSVDENEDLALNWNEAKVKIPQPWKLHQCVDYGQVIDRPPEVPPDSNRQSSLSNTSRRPIGCVLCIFYQGTGNNIEWSQANSVFVPLCGLRWDALPSRSCFGFFQHLASCESIIAEFRPSSRTLALAKFRLFVEPKAPISTQETVRQSLPITQGPAG